MFYLEPTCIAYMNCRVDMAQRAGHPLTEVDMNAVKYLQTIGMPMEDVSHQTLNNKIQVSGNLSDYATNTSSDRDLDQLVSVHLKHFLS